MYFKVNQKLLRIQSGTFNESYGLNFGKFISGTQYHLPDITKAWEIDRLSITSGMALISLRIVSEENENFVIERAQHKLLRETERTFSFVEVWSMFIDLGYFDMP